MNKFFEAIGLGIVAFVVVIGLSLLLAFPTKWAINYVVNPTLLATVFTTGHFSVWHAWALNFLASSLVKSTNTGSTK
jgi:hypothetical protein